MKTKQLIKLEHKTKKVVIDAKNVDNYFNFMPDRRKIYPGHVKALYDVLENDENFNTPFVVNELTRAGKRLVDANHRVEAIRRFLEDYPKKKVEVEMHVYKDLTEQEEREVFRKYNSGRKQSTNDFIQINQSDISIWQMIKKEKMPLSVTIYANPNTIPLYRLFESYFLATEGAIFSGAMIMKPQMFVDRLKNLGKEDFKLIKAFLIDMVNTFGFPKGNPFYATSPFKALFRIWNDNKDNMTQEKMLNSFQKKILNDFECRDCSKLTGASGAVYTRAKYLQKLNGGLLNGSGRFDGDRNIED